MNDLAPQEDRLEFPASWRAKLLPWRGRRTGEAVEPDPAWLGRWQRGVMKRERQLRTALAKRGNAPFAAAVETYLDGKADPRGAAAIATLILDYDGRGETSRLRPEFDCWLLEHGLAFATAAAVERLAVDPATGGEFGDYYGGSSIAERTVLEHETVHPEAIHHELAFGGIAAVRATLAAASDEEYARVVAAVAPHRDTAPKRMAAMILFPTEHEWVREACADYGKARYWASADRVVLQAASRPEHLEAAHLAEVDDYIADADMLAALLGGLGTEALPFLAKTLERHRHYNDDFRKQLYRAIALVPRDDAMAVILSDLDSPGVWEAATEAASRFPIRALRVAARLAPAASADVRLWTTAVASRVDPGLHAHLDGADRAVLAELLADGGRVPDADPGELPPLLTAPPWTRKRPKTKRAVIEGLEPPAETRLDWAEGEFEAWGRHWHYFEYSEWFTDGTLQPDLDDFFLMSFLANARLELAEQYLERWDGGANDGFHEPDLQRLLARYGERVVDRLLGLAATHHDCSVIPGPIINPAAARIAAERLDRLKSARPSAIAWFDRHGLAAVPYLLPDALGADGRRRRYAETALVHLADEHGGPAVAAAAEPFGPEAAAAIASLVDLDPLEPRGKVPKPADWAIPLILPQVLLKGGRRALPAASVRHLITVLALGTPDFAYPGVAVVADACDRDSLARFSRALFDRWTAVGAPAKDAWALTQLVHFADDAAVWELASRIRVWPGHNQHRRAVTGLEVLGAIGTEEALRAVQTVAEKVKFNALKRVASWQIERIADDLGLSREQLADRLVPDFGLGEQGALVFDYGPRRFTVAFDEQLRPLITDAAGKPRKSLPRPGAKDDPELAEESYARFAALRKELRGVAADQVRRMEAAMVSARDWSAAEFRRCFAEHALLGHLARRLVWLAEADGDRFGFRIAEDGSYSDVDDARIALPEGARIRVAHPVHLGADARTWAALFADYEILQPFEQLNRPVMAFTEAELATGRLRRFEGAKVEVNRVLGMTARGWQRAAPADGGVEPGLVHPLPGGCVTVSLDPGVFVGDVREFPVQTVKRVVLATKSRYESDIDDSDFAVPTDIDPLAASEALATLARATYLA